ncbi:MAG: prepilin-type N-terminal cleavage/methylation domain-containing protein [Candidatus Dojkabacteria bacterium]|nr:prepilin-type N-terminal cleavage/methylation domain-containing protein [Candidatus Dojkabacteria bacterium]MDQ7020456.1 prepilin-type N-terminal cleavage/methylation domain-containing protein [Candidatus Dojkabacteria bacterium]
MNLHLKSKKNKKGFSLIEVIVSLTVIALVLTLFFNIFILSSNITFKTLARSKVRESLSDLTSLISRDIRNSEYIVECGLNSIEGSESCEFVVGGTQYLWHRCEEYSYCKEEKDDATGNYNTIFETDGDIVIDKVKFEKGFSSENGTTSSQNNVLFTVIGSHFNTNLEVTNLIQQISISTRNYEF